MWDPQLFIFHYGPRVKSAGDLESVLAACAGMPCTEDAPCGWAIFGRHVDDGLGLASGQAVVDYMRCNMLFSSFTFLVFKTRRGVVLLGSEIFCRSSPHFCCFPSI